MKKAAGRAQRVLAGMQETPARAKGVVEHSKGGEPGRGGHSQGARAGAGVPFDDFHFNLASLAHQILLRNEKPNGDAALKAMLTAWRLLELAKAFEEERGDPSEIAVLEGRGVLRFPIGFRWNRQFRNTPHFDAGEFLSVKGFAQRVGIKRTTLDGYIRHLGNSPDYKQQLAHIRKEAGPKSPYKYDARELWQLLYSCEVTKRKIQTVRRRQPQPRPPLIKHMIEFPSEIGLSEQVPAASKVPRSRSPKRVSKRAR